ncbi:MAG: glucosaminidase domain-containing protein [Thermogemmatispora sp.]|uniref:glucosaminidase domain-containing protein n=1 Tax=Thermogemmatispora sp. TaxID=1968838 RepID=UPI0019FD12B6|nr:glucosaminidase domain-containing protein [Thermogemmatispora sp.]MBE3564229.1 glucosaminidase domain-containing protein [Thermogemmatispora sp.]
MAWQRCCEGVARLAGFSDNGNMMKSKLITQTVQPAFPQPPLRRSLQAMLISLALLLVGALVLTWQIMNGSTGSQASSASVLGPPTLPAETVNTILASTPMAGTGQVVEEAARQTNIDDAFALAVWYVETNQGAAGVGLGDHNPGGVRASASYPSDAGGYTIYPSYAAAIQDWFSIVQQRYIARGLTTVYLIAGPYVGTSSSGSWAAKVMNLMTIYRNEAPPPTPTPTPTPATLKYKIATTLQSKSGQQADAEREDSQPQPTVSFSTASSAPAITATSAANELNKPSGQNAVVVVLGLSSALALALAAIWLRRRQRLLTALLGSASAEVGSKPEPVTDTLVLATVPIQTAAETSLTSLVGSLPGRDTDALPLWNLPAQPETHEALLAAASHSGSWPGPFSHLPELQPIPAGPAPASPIQPAPVAVPLLAGRSTGPGSGLLSRYGSGHPLPSSAQAARSETRE